MPNNLSNTNISLHIMIQPMNQRPRKNSTGALTTQIFLSTHGRYSHIPYSDTDNRSWCTVRSSISITSIQPMRVSKYYKSGIGIRSGWLGRLDTHSSSGTEIVHLFFSLFFSLSPRQIFVVLHYFYLYTILYDATSLVNLGNRGERFIC